MKYRADWKSFFSRSRWRWNSCGTNLWLKVRIFQNLFVHISGNFQFEIYWPLMHALRIDSTPMWPLIARFSAVTFQTLWCKSFFTFTTRHLVSKWHPWYNATYKLERAVKNKKGGRSQTTFTRFVFFWPPNPLRLHFLWYKSLQKVNFFDHLPPSSCKRSLWTPPYLTSLTWIQMTWLFPWPKISVTQGLGVLRVRMNCSDLFKCCISTLN